MLAEHGIVLKLKHKQSHVYHESEGKMGYKTRGRQFLTRHFETVT